MSREWIRGTCGGKDKWLQLLVKHGGLKTWSPSWNATNTSGRRFKEHVTHKLSRTKRMGQRPTLHKKQELGRRRGYVWTWEHALGEGCVCMRCVCEYVRCIWDVCEKWVCMSVKHVWMYVYIRAVCVGGCLWGVSECVQVCALFIYMGGVCVCAGDVLCMYDGCVCVCVEGNCRKKLRSLHSRRFLVCSGSHNKTPQTGWLKWQTFISDSSGDREVPDQGVGRFGSWLAWGQPPCHCDLLWPFLCEYS